MAAGRYNITAEQGSTFTLDFTVDTDGSLWDLTSYSARMQVREAVAAVTKYLDLTSAAGDIALTSLGEVTVTVSATDMSAVPAGRHVYDIELVSSGGIVTRILEGRFVVSPEVTA